EEHRIHGALHSDVEFGYLPLRYREYLHASKSKLFVDLGDVRLITAEAIHRLSKDNVELPPHCGVKELLDTRSLDDAESGDRVITKFCYDLPLSPLSSEFTAYQKLAVDRFRILLIA